MSDQKKISKGQERRDKKRALQKKEQARLRAMTPEQRRIEEQRSQEDAEWRRTLQLRAEWFRWYGDSGFGDGRARPEDIEQVRRDVELWLGATQEEEAEEEEDFSSRVCG